MPKANVYINDLLKGLLNATAIANVFDNAGSSPLTNLYVSLHTSSPGVTGNQQTNECAYTSYARVAVARTSSGFTASSAQTSSPVAAITFPACTGSTETATHFAIGSVISSTGKIFYFGTVTPNISISSGVTPSLTTASTITEA